MSRLFPVAAALLLTGLPFAPVFAQGVDTSDSAFTLSKRVDISGLDLTREQDWRIAARRVETTAQNICQTLATPQADTFYDIEACAQDARQNTFRDLRDLREYQQDSHRRGHVILAGDTDGTPRL
ncbi:UrcA family protein [Gluconobacter morbifer]|uniref:UrcA family protein n=1 Tax=Gluconobacter morbifer G707 TaxID=1088869 RepID=G6XJV8_9PROT|nr:UrcA family protein [Gluconobacter morbifer]EHH67920.1 hypothetical protein GMO_16870 [Gluconobacter morbifer G707]